MKEMTETNGIEYSIWSKGSFNMSYFRRKTFLAIIRKTGCYRNADRDNRNYFAQTNNSEKIIHILSSGTTSLHWRSSFGFFIENDLTRSQISIRKNEWKAATLISSPFKYYERKNSAWYPPKDYTWTQISAAVCSHWQIIGWNVSFWHKMVF